MCKDLKYPILLDGGLSYVLERSACDLNHKLWSAHLLFSDPEKILNAHLSYLEAGAECLITSSYQASIQGFLDLGHDLDEAKKYILRSVELAVRARDIFYKKSNSSRKIYIAASIGSYGAYLADGSEYYGSYEINDDDLRDFHLSRIEILDTSEADFFACETIPSLREANILANIFNNTDKKAWIAFSCKDGQHICDGTPIVKAISGLIKFDSIFAVGVNCSDPNFISSLIRLIKSVTKDKKIAIYPNSGEAYCTETKTWLSLSKPPDYIKMVREWLDLGADILGGCCGIGPKHIQSIGKIIHS